jgi:predicted ATPase
MLTKIWVDGFRSLNDFTFEPKQGLNVLVGANGAGKTNIIDFLKFIGQLEHKNLIDAMNSIGGVPSVFTRFYNDFRKPIIFGFTADKTEYEATIVYNEKGLYFENQKITNWNGIEEHYSDDDKKKYAFYNFRISGLISSKTNKFYTIFSLGHLKYNFEPQKIKQFEPFGLSSMKEDGEGFSTSFKEFKTIVEGLRLDKELNIFETMAKFMRKDFLRIEVIPDLIRNVFETYCFFKTDNDNKEIEIPITHISDGMAKWLALSYTLANLGELNIYFYLEEPENFLHPELQRVFIKMLRERMEETGGIAIISTHSETILNNIRSEEVVMVTLEDGKTRANRIPDSEHLNNVIRESGFGLGYFFATGDLE